MNLPITPLTIFTTILRDRAGAFHTFLQFRFGKAKPTQFTPLLRQTRDLYSIFGRDEFTHIDVIQIQSGTKLATDFKD